MPILLPRQTPEFPPWPITNVKDRNRPGLGACCASRTSARAPITPGAGASISTGRKGSQPKRSLRLSFCRHPRFVIVSRGQVRAIRRGPSLARRWTLGLSLRVTKRCDHAWQNSQDCDCRWRTSSARSSLVESGIGRRLSPRPSSLPQFGTHENSNTGCHLTQPDRTFVCS